MHQADLRNLSTVRNLLDVLRVAISVLATAFLLVVHRIDHRRYAKWMLALGPFHVRTEQVPWPASNSVPCRIRTCLGPALSVRPLGTFLVLEIDQKRAVRTAVELRGAVLVYRRTRNCKVHLDVVGTD